MKKFILLMVSMFFTGIITAQDSYSASFKIHLKNELIGTPSVIAFANKQAGISVSNSYKLSFTIKPTKESSVFVPIKLNIEGKEYNPEVEVVLGEEASLIINELKMSILISKPRT